MLSGSLLSLIHYSLAGGKYFVNGPFLTFLYVLRISKYLPVIQILILPNTNL